MPGFGFGATIGAARLPAVATVLATVPADWRMPAVTTTSVGLAGSLTSLMAAQNAASSKSRPSFTVASGATDYVEWTVSEAGTAILSWIGQSAGTASLTRFIVNGVTQSPEISPVNNVSNYLVVPNVAPDAGGKITVRAQRGVSGAFAYMTVLRLLRQA